MDRMNEKEVNEDASILIPKIDPEKKSNGKTRGSFWKSFSKRKKIIFILLGGLSLFALVLFFLFFSVYKSALEVKASGENLKQALNEQSLPKVETELENTKNSLNNFEKTYSRIYWIRIIPYFGGFIRDGNHFIFAGKYGLEASQILADVATPYADIIGFSGENGHDSESGEETAKDRLDFIVKTLPDVIPKAQALAEKAMLARDEINKVDTKKYPETIAGKKIRENLEEVVDLVNLGARFVVEGKPLLEVSPYLLGSDSPREYLVIFQNDKELRPTGGFITAYSIAKVDKGKFEPVLSSDIYNLDNAYTPKITAPDPIVNYIKGPYILSKKLRLRDMNWSPDFSESMDLFTTEAEKAGIDEVDGIIAVDTEALVNLLEVLGPIGVPGYGEFSNKIIDECNCPQVIYELESFADIEGPVVWSQDEPGKIIFAPPNYDNRKKIIGPLMNSILSNALGQPKEKMPALFEAMTKSLFEKHVMLYVHDDKAQAAVKTFGIGGVIEQTGSDYLHINDANLGGRKSNLYVTQEVVQTIKVGKDKSVEKEIEITYKNPEKFDGWLNSVLPNWVRVYVPEGSELISFDGVEDKEDPYTELGKTVYAGYFELRPQGVVKLNLKYKLPFKADDTYEMLIQKQPGKNKPFYTIHIGKNEEEFYLDTDKEFNFSI